MSLAVMTSRVLKEQQSRDRTANKAEERLSDLYDKLGDIDKELERHIVAYRKAARDIRARQPKRAGELMEAVRKMDDASKMVGRMQGSIDQSARMAVKILKNEFKDRLGSIDSPKTLDADLDIEAREALKAARKRISVKAEGVAKASLKEERKVIGSESPTRMWGMLYKVGQAFGARDIAGTREQMFGRLDELLDSKDAIYKYIERETEAYVAARMVGDARKAARGDVGGRASMYAIPEFFRGARAEDYIPKITSRKRQAPAVREVEPARVAQLGDYYNSLKDKVGDNALDTRIRHALIAAHKESATEDSFIEARRLMNEAWILFSGNLMTSERRERLLDRNSKVSTVAEQDALLNSELITYIEDNSRIFYEKEGLSVKGQEFASSIAEKASAQPITGSEFASSRDWETLWEDVWSVYRKNPGMKRRGAGDAAESGPVPPISA